MRGNAIDNCIKDIKAYTESNSKYVLPYFVNVESQADYIDLYNKLGEITISTVNTSKYCRNQDAVPDIDKLVKELKSMYGSVLLLGFTEYLKLRGEEQLISRLSILKDLSSDDLKLIVITYQCEKELSTFLRSDLRLKERIYFIDSIADTVLHYTFVNINIPKEIHKDNIILGFKDFLFHLETKQLANTIVATKIDGQLFKNAITSIKIIFGSFETICFFSDFSSSRFASNMGTEENWKWLLDKILRNNSYLKTLELELSTSYNLPVIFHKWKLFTNDQKWLYWLTLHTDVNDESSYLITSAQKSKSVETFISQIYLSILDEGCFSNKFKCLYDERKILIANIQSIKDENDFCTLAIAKEKNKIYYLTDIGDIEQKEVVKCLCDYRYEQDEINGVLKQVYPKLFNYLLPYHFDIKMLDEYFQCYKYSKITNCITDDFLRLVNENACNREFNVLPTRIEKFEKIDKNNAEFYFLDALGVEFLGYIMQKSNELGMEANVTVCRANLPTITECNKDFAVGISNKPFFHDIKKIDDLKHSGEGDFDYRKNKYPLHILKELEILDEVLRNALTKLSDKDKAIIVSDHGASRLVVINEHQYDFDVESKGTHGGRCCEYTENIQKIKYATEENGYYVLASHDRFKGGRAASVETHGGATLEEVVVPIIELTLKNSNIVVNLKEKEVLIGHNIKPVLVLVSNCKLKNPQIRIDGIYLKLDRSDKYQYHFSLAEIKKSKTYKADVFDNNNHIREVEFILKRASFTENDLL